MKTVKLPTKRRPAMTPRAVRVETAKPGPVTIDRVLVPIDFSEESHRAIDHALLFSRYFEADLDLVHVFEPDYPIASLAGMPMFVPETEVVHRVRRHLHEAALRHHLLLPKKNIHAIKGGASQEICRLADRIGTDLIIISTHGNTGLKHFVLGSTAERIVRHASCPVMVIRRKDAKRASRNGKPASRMLFFRKIVVPIDFSACSFKGLAYAKGLAKRLGSTLVLIHSLPPQYYVTSEEYGRYDLPLLMGQIENSAREQLRKLVETAKREGIKVEATLEIGHPGQQICSRAQDRGADLIVTSTHGKTGLQHVFLGSTAEYVVRHATCPVLVVPTRKRPIPKKP
jgi:nucleotide-binding universal stress UspA family protein